jgi:hypothetical protein
MQNFEQRSWIYPTPRFNLNKVKLDKKSSNLWCQKTFFHLNIFIMSMRTLFLIVLNIALGGLFFFSCDKEANTEIKGIETFEMTGGDGQCYEVTLERLKDKSVNFIKKQVPCSEGFSTRTGVYISQDVKTQKDANRRRITILEGNETRWFIPLGGGEPIESPGNIECFCEKQTVSPGGDPCNGQGECFWQFGGQWTRCNDGGCCDECDMRICEPTRNIRIGDGGVIVYAASVNMISDSKSIERNEDNYIFYGGNTRMGVERNGNLVTITRTSLEQVNHPKKLYNLTSLTPSGNTINIPANGNYWYIQFEPGTTQSIINVPPTCNSDPDDPCTSECNLEYVNGCLECKCLLKGDCDMSIAFRPGGVIIQSENIQLVDN